MARTGLYQSEVKKARDALVAQGKHPSVDAVRVALGNTGSKTTIHKYLKELEDMDGGDRKAPITEALQDLVARLAARLHADADARIAEIEAECAETERRSAAALQQLQQDMTALGIQMQHAEAATQQEKSAHVQTRVALQNESIARHTAEQQVADLRERLTENDEHRLSIEEKHTHARQALEHYRQSVKEQRDQDLRRHEQQIQQLQAELRQLQQSLAVKQDDITRLNQEGACLATDLSHANKSLYEQQSQARQYAQQVATLQLAEQRANLLAVQLASEEARAQGLERQVASADAKTEAFSIQVRELELALATTQAMLESQQEVAAELRSLLATFGAKTD